MHDEQSVQGYPKVNAECRALIVCEAAPAPSLREIPNRSAAFVTHLLAIKEDLPQTRERRREEPSVAAQLYEAQMADLPQREGDLLSRAA